MLDEADEDEVAAVVRSSEPMLVRTLKLGCATDEVLRHVAALSELHELSLGESDQVSNLSPLFFSFHGFSEAGFTSIWRVTDEGLGHLSRLKSLQRLTLQRCTNITSEGLRALCSLHALETLDLTSCVNVTDEAMRYVSALPALRELVLQDCGVTDAGLRHLSTLPFLTKLWLNGCRVTDEGLCHVSRLLSLQNLALSCCKITDDGMLHLARLPVLQTLDLRGCGKITPKGLSVLGDWDIVR